jgi:DNA-directed RNA polymerase subunit N (RpoN/RPB10)
MIIPVLCYCGKVIADCYDYYDKTVKERTEKLQNKNEESISKIRNDVLNELKINRMCCRRMILSHVEIINFT